MSNQILKNSLDFMPLTSSLDQRQKIREIATLAGIKPFNKEDYHPYAQVLAEEIYENNISDYFHSLDAIMPVIRKSIGDNLELRWKFIDCLNSKTGFYSNTFQRQLPEQTGVWCWHMLTATPEQLCNALLKVNGFDV